MSDYVTKEEFNDFLKQFALVTSEARTNRSIADSKKEGEYTPMERQNFLISMVKKHRCVCCDVLEKECRAVDGFAAVCVGKLDSRPEWCPLYEISKEVDKGTNIFVSTTGSDIQTINTLDCDQTISE